MRVLIIGAGVIGCATAYELRRLGVDVTVIDRHGEVGHGSTSASCGIVRRFYTQPGMIALAHEGAAAYAEWSEHIGPIDDDLAVFQRPGMLFIPPRFDESVTTTVEAMRAVGVPVEVLDADEVTERFPFFAADASRSAGGSVQAGSIPNTSCAPREPKRSSRISIRSAPTSAGCGTPAARESRVSSLRRIIT